jgi:hypothetical protein
VGVAQLDPPLLTDEDGSGTAALERIGLAAARDLFTTPQSCAVAGGLKLLRRGNDEEIYDLAADPLEARPLRPDDPALEDRSADVQRLRDALDQPAMTGGGETPVPSTAATTASDEEMRELEERMRLLGYM